MRRGLVLTLRSLAVGCAGPTPALDPVGEARVLTWTTTGQMGRSSDRRCQENIRNIWDRGRQTEFCMDLLQSGSPFLLVRGRVGVIKKKHIDEPRRHAGNLSKEAEMGEAIGGLV